MNQTQEEARKLLIMGKTPEEVKEKLESEGHSKKEIKNALHLLDWKKDLKTHRERKLKPRAKRTYPKHIEQKATLQDLHNLLSVFALPNVKSISPSSVVVLGNTSTLIIWVFYAVLLLSIPSLNASIIAGIFSLVLMFLMIIHVQMCLHFSDIQVENLQRKLILTYVSAIILTALWVLFSAYSVSVAATDSPLTLPGTSFNPYSVAYISFIFLNLLPNPPYQKNNPS